MGALAAVLVLCAPGVASWVTGWLALLQGGVEIVDGLLPVGLALILAELLEKERKAGAILFGMGFFALVRLAAVLTFVTPAHGLGRRKSFFLWRVARALFSWR